MSTISTAHWLYPGVVGSRGNAAESGAAGIIAELEREMRDQLWQSQAISAPWARALATLAEVTRDASGTDWDGEGARPVALAAVDNARRLLLSLPSSGPFPEVSATKQGLIALDWIFDRQRSLSAVIHESGKVTVAWSDRVRRSRGTDHLSDGLPRLVDLGLKALTS